MLSSSPPDLYCLLRKVKDYLVADEKRDIIYVFSLHQQSIKEKEETKIAGVRAEEKRRHDHQVTPLLRLETTSL